MLSHEELKTETIVKELPKSKELKIR